jgi:membrane protein YdbS with pleckstrin-like domain
MFIQKDILHRSPFTFLKNFIVIEVIFALVPITLAAFLNLEGSYETIGLARSIPFVLIWTIFITLLQIIAVTIAFLFWYMPRYVLAEDGIYFRYGPGGELKLLVDYRRIQDVSVKQGILARRLSYGSIILLPPESAMPIKIQDIPYPTMTAEEIMDRARRSILVEDDTVPPMTVEEILAAGESQFVEYKSSLMWDYRQQRVNKKLYTPVMKSLTAFMNSRGGHLLIGVDDDGNILGIEADLQGLKKPNLDGWENTFNLAFNKMIGVEYRRLIKLNFYEKDGKTICHIYAKPANTPIFLKENNTEKFYVRAGNASQPLAFSQAARYIQARFRN